MVLCSVSFSYAVQKVVLTASDQMSSAAPLLLPLEDTLQDTDKPDPGVAEPTNKTTCTSNAATGGDRRAERW